MLFHMDEHTFYRHLRVTHAQFDHLVEVLGHQGLKGYQHDGGLEIPVKQKVALFLWYMANQNSFREMSDKFNVSQSSAHRYMLLGDSAYISRDYTFIITPKRDNGALTVQDQQRNTNICRGRVVVEQAFGRVKYKWRRMRDLQNTRLDVVVMLIMSACMLHNLCTGPADMCEDHPAGCPCHEDENI
ncbi:hypothetical protein AAFF_G00083630 [Aldrovandia affinis]|uniref:DDE Tnp4 domain-containing protein n=1 Tax=Aldrovandia affinis TaxID=143900 RepID=A0AAD7RX29_9TELE|nr:hypothetical protein AAFF_G00083630 [Aldrovandia affinis]